MSLIYLHLISDAKTILKIEFFILLYFFFLLNLKTLFLGLKRQYSLCMLRHKMCAWHFPFSEGKSIDQLHAIFRLWRYYPTKKKLQGNLLYVESHLIKFKRPEVCGYTAVCVCVYLNRKQMTGQNPHLMIMYCTLHIHMTQTEGSRNVDSGF